MNATGTTNIVDIRYAQNGRSTQTNELGMREMQAKAYEARNERFLLTKVPSAVCLVLCLLGVSSAAAWRDISQALCS